MEMGAALGSVNWLAIVVAAVVTFVLGGLWYGPIAGKVWMRAAGMTEERARQGNQALIFGVSFACQLVAALVLAMFIGPTATLGFGASAGAAVGVAWVATAIAVLYLFEQRPLVHWAVNAGYHTIAFTVMGAILGAWH